MGPKKGVSLSRSLPAAPASKVDKIVPRFVSARERTGGNKVANKKGRHVRPQSMVRLPAGQCHDCRLQHEVLRDAMAAAQTAEQ